MDDDDDDDDGGEAGVVVFAVDLQVLCSISSVYSIVPSARSRGHLKSFEAFIYWHPSLTGQFPSGA